MKQPIAALRPAVRAMLGEGGVLASQVPGWRYSAEQEDYALRVCALLEAPWQGDDPRTALATLEAATGIGKTIGYLVPLLLYAHLTGRRVGVATYTLDLLRAIERGAFPQVNALVSAHLGRAPLTLGVRTGMREHVSAQRVEAAIDALPSASAEAAAVLEDLLAFAVAGRDGAHAGLLADWKANGHALPAGISDDDVNLRAYCMPSDLAAYTRQCDASAGADCVLTTQAMALLHCMRRTDLVSGAEDVGDLDALVVDEADRIGDMAEAVAGTYLPLTGAARELADFAEARRRGVARVARELGLTGDALLASLTGESGMRQFLHGSKGAKARNAVLKHLPGLKDAVRDARSMPSVRDDMAMRDTLDGWLWQLSDIEAVLRGDGGYRCAYLQRSPVRGYVGLGTVSVDPGRLLAQLWRRSPGDGSVRSLLLTSATLSTTERGMAAFMRGVGIDPMEHRLVAEASGAIEPRRHGALSFVYADPDAPRPARRTDGEDDGIAPEWVDYATRMIGRAHAEGGRTLVLCGSYAEAASLAASAANAGMTVIQARRGSRDADIAAFRGDPAAIMVTPTGWEGLDLPGLIQHLVIARLPYQSLDTPTLAAVRLVMESKGYTRESAENVARVRMFDRALRRLRQGIGRPIRGYDDAATVWFADARMPLPLSLRDAWWRAHPPAAGIERGKRPAAHHGHPGMALAIPRRFAGQPGRVFRLDGTEWSPEHAA